MITDYHKTHQDNGVNVFSQVDNADIVDFSDSNDKNNNYVHLETVGVWTIAFTCILASFSYFHIWHNNQSNSKTLYALLHNNIVFPVNISNVFMT